MEMIGKAAETNLNLQSAQHKRETMDLHRELSSLRSRPDLENSLKELQERNNEMEELLRTKCAEIEANDDRVLEYAFFYPNPSLADIYIRMMKENKKLSTKVESLSRKVTNLQTKLTAAKATAQMTNVSPPSVLAPANDLPRRRSNNASSAPPIPPMPIFVNHAHSPGNYTHMSRTVSGPSSLARPKTPERGHPPPVFKARTPEEQIVPDSLEINSIPSTSSIGKKRRAPDDFEDYDSLPPQVFTAESVPGDCMESTTPRARRVLSSIHSGFTPRRGRLMASPKRAVTTGSTRASPVIADVTNSPRSASQSAKSSKRSWLGKIRGVSTETTGRQASSRQLFERGKDS
ncbi:hypothetical protein BD779DRAFT_58470 [Infundibulicybe gibba]|nr:hypothetical protein BD779DRAFT_58470 [Infundibulicybe gibba]